MMLLGSKCFLARICVGLTLCLIALTLPMSLWSLPRARSVSTTSSKSGYTRLDSFSRSNSMRSTTSTRTFDSGYSSLRSNSSYTPVKPAYTPVDPTPHPAPTSNQTYTRPVYSSRSLGFKLGYPYPSAIIRTAPENEPSESAPSNVFGPETGYNSSEGLGATLSHDAGTSLVVKGAGYVDLKNASSEELRNRGGRDSAKVKPASAQQIHLFSQMLRRSKLPINNKPQYLHRYEVSDDLKNGWTNVLRQYFKNRPDELKELNQAVRATPAAGDDWQRVEGLKKLIKTMAEEKKIQANQDVLWQRLTEITPEEYSATLFLPRLPQAPQRPTITKVRFGKVR